MTVNSQTHLFSTNGYDYYSYITKWQSGTDLINNQNCFAANFGYKGELPLPAINLPIITNENLKKHEFEGSHHCFFAFVGGNYVQDMETIVESVKVISGHLHGIKPVAMFVMGKFNSIEIEKFSFHGQEFTKVRWIFHNSKIVG